MNSKRSHSNSSRFEGCTITGTLAVTAFIRDAVSIIHGPSGCAHHNLSLIHATLLGQETLPRCRILSTGLAEQDIIFGGEDALEEAIGRVSAQRPGVIFVLSTCISDTIGDDVEAVTSRDWGLPVRFIRCGGFFGGSFHEGFAKALMAAASLAPPSEIHDADVNIVGERNLEFEVEESYREVARLLRALDLEVNVRFVRNVSTGELQKFGRGSLNILREDPAGTLSDFFGTRYEIPSLSGFPVGLSGTIRFLEDVGEILGIDAREAVREELALQEELASEFDDLAGATVSLDAFGFQCPEAGTLEEVAGAVGLRFGPEGTVIPIPIGSPVGTSGVRHMLRQWRRFLHG
ncbi:MAG: nitrogenase component 1 [Methanomicrobiaceae archaeon]|nr:nitrogenase component 1 [Methanomicrobiaceae archaeon]